jgi:putative Mn2+ efflux pump MntP
MNVHTEHIPREKVSMKNFVKEWIPVIGLFITILLGVVSIYARLVTVEQELRGQQGQIDTIEKVVDRIETRIIQETLPVPVHGR